MRSYEGLVVKKKDISSPPAMSCGSPARSNGLFDICTTISKVLVSILFVLFFSWFYWGYTRVSLSRHCFVFFCSFLLQRYCSLSTMLDLRHRYINKTFAVIDFRLCHLVSSAVYAFLCSSFVCSIAVVALNFL